MCIYIITHHACPHTSLLLQERCPGSLSRRMSTGGGRYESPPCRFDRERFERWKREAEGQENEETPATRERRDEGKWKKNGGGRKMESEFRERWAEGLCVKCKAEKEGSRALARKSSFAEIVKNLLSIDRELQAQRLSVHSASGRGKSAIPPVPMIGKRRGMR
ncbi:uncharacterized protein EAF02_001056 [Botrytis sinoallii]|uniref:uncharacterized protein n=1 Tax=Botrytis sinoallii TaxID=1463999 RepID=UPI001900D968|nr:uncharacterized protein EAF02_001056 [Botrytis sinoallii]KAF7893518.1 hypothetical protein EAF02_001056 [Botrytis sinoallii]